MATQIADSQTKAEEPDFLGIYHVNVNVTDIGRSRAFYEMIGFRLLEEFSYAGEPELDRGLGLPFSHTSALFMGIGKGRHATILDLVEWHEPRAEGAGLPINGIGMPRIALRVKNIDALYENLQANGVPTVAPIERLWNLENAECRFFIAKDPDGLHIEFVELMPKPRGGKARKQQD